MTFWLVVWILLCLLVGKLAAARHRSAIAWFAASILLSPLIGALLLLLLPPAKPRQLPPAPQQPAPGPADEAANARVAALLAHYRVTQEGGWFVHAGRRYRTAREAIAAAKAAK